MRKGRAQSRLVERFAAGALSRRPDALIVEEPMSVLLDGTLVATTMRTPGHDFELAVGLCHTDGLLAEAPVTGVRYCGAGSAAESEFNAVTVETGGRAPEPEPRLGPSTSSCGLCGTASLTDLQLRLTPLTVDPFPLEVLAGAPERVRPEQPLFAETGSVHAAATIAPDGQIDLVREDIGRHNAVDKVVGRLLLDGDLPVSARALYVSGRASFEIVQKAWSAGFAALVAVSAPSALAVDCARAAGITLAGFARDGEMNLYTRV